MQILFTSPFWIWTNLSATWLAILHLNISLILCCFCFILSDFARLTLQFTLSSSFLMLILYSHLSLSLSLSFAHNWPKFRINCVNRDASTLFFLFTESASTHLDTPWLFDHHCHPFFFERLKSVSSSASHKYSTSPLFISFRFFFLILCCFNPYASLFLKHTSQIHNDSKHVSVVFFYSYCRVPFLITSFTRGRINHVGRWNQHHRNSRWFTNTFVWYQLI